MKITMPSLHPRNPLIVPALLRRAGAHRRSVRTQRQQGARTLTRELKELHRSP